MTCRGLENAVFRRVDCGVEGEGVRVRFELARLVSEKDVDTPT